MHDNISRPCVQHGVTPFFHAVKQAKDLALLGRLLEAKADPDAADNDGQTALMWSAKEGHKNLLDYCFRVGAKPDAMDSAGKTAMAFAYDGGHADIMSHLIAKGANPNVLHPEEGLPILICATQKGHRDMVEAMVSAVKSRGAEQLKRFVDFETAK